MVFIFLVIGIPLILSLFFTSRTNGKIVINERIEAPYLNNNGKDLQLVFYGYVGCTKVCAPMLHDLSVFYDSAEFSPLKPFVGFSFVNLMPQIKPDQPDVFAKSFNPLFNGIYLTQKEIMTIDREFGLFFSRRLSEPDEIDHSDYLYLVQRQENGDLILLNIYMTHPLNSKSLVTDIQHYLKGAK